MSTLRFTLGTSFVWDQIRYEVAQLLPDQHVRLLNPNTGAVRVVPLLELTQALLKKTLHIDSPTQETSPDGFQELSDYTAHQIDTARYRLRIIQPLIDHDVRSRQQVQDYVRLKQAEWGDGTETNPLSVASLYRWVSDYKKSGQDIRALIPKSTQQGAATRGRERETNAVIESVLKEKLLSRGPDSRQPKRPSSSQLHQIIAARLEAMNGLRPQTAQLVIPSHRTIKRRMAQLDPVARYTSQYGQRAARQKYTQYGQMNYPETPLERVEVDHTALDLIVIDDDDQLPLGRPTLTTFLDTATRYPIGLYIGFEPPSYATVKEAMYQAILPKEELQQSYGTDHAWQAYGLFDTLVVDNGKEFIGHDLQDVCQSLGIRLIHAPVRMPEFKAGVERAFRTYNVGLLHGLPGTTFSNVQERGDYRSVENAVLTLATLKRIFYTYIIDIYAQSLHSGLQAVPAQRWEAALKEGFTPRLPANQEALYILLGRTTTRTLQHSGIHLEGLRYNLVRQGSLAALRAKLDGQAVKVKYHPDNLSRIHIFDPFEKRYIEIPALDQSYTHNLSLWKHRVIRKEARQTEGQVDAAALGRARERINQMVEQSRSASPRTTRKKKARWNAVQHNGAVALQNTSDSDSDVRAQQLARLNRLIGTISDEGWEIGPRLSDLKS